jgi:glycosyltransferase involved in cell wall biosynthesis
VGDPVTIAIPFHRNPDYLRTAIESVFAQSSPDWRLLVVDDSGGASGAPDVVAAYDDSRLAFHANPEKLGMVANWNRCLELAESDLVTLLHADDRLEPGYVASMQDLAHRYPEAAGLYCGARIIDAEGRRRFSFADSIKRVFAPRVDGATVLRGRAAVCALMRGNFIMCPTLCYRRSRLDGERFSADWQQVQDLEFTTRLLMAGRELVGSKQVAYAYRRHGQAATTLQSDSLLRFEEEFRLFELVAERADALGWDEVARVARRKAIVRLHLGYRAVGDALRGRPGPALRKLRFALRR